MYKIRLGARSKSSAKIGPFPREDYVVGQKYRIYYELENIGRTPFPGGTLQVYIHWPNGQIVGQRFSIDPLAPGASCRTKIRDTDALARGFALIYVSPIIAQDGVSVEMCSSPGKRLQQISPALNLYHIHSIYAKPTEEITGYWAMWISAVSLLLFVIINLIQFLLGLLNL